MDRNSMAASREETLTLSDGCSSKTRRSRRRASGFRI